VYNVAENSFDMLAEYGRDFVMECLCESVQWYYLRDMHEAAGKQIDKIMHEFLPLVKDVDPDITMYPIFPLTQVLKLIGRARDANCLVKTYVIDPYHEDGGISDYWTPLFNPLVYLLDMIILEEAEQIDSQMLEELESWVLSDEHDDYDLELERKAHTAIGEICWRLIAYKDEDDPSRDVLVEKARDLLTPVARYPHNEIFLKHTARALLEALD
jgi:hypothetical protein